MVQLPATAAIEYVAACCRTRTRTRKRTKTKTRTKTRTRTKIGTITEIVRGAYARSHKLTAYTHRPGFHRSVTDKKTDKLGLLAPRGVDPRSPNFQDM